LRPVCRSGFSERITSAVERLEAANVRNHAAAARDVEDSKRADNYRAALRWALPPDPHQARSARQAELGLQLCAAMGWSWVVGNQLTEGLLWLSRAVELGPNEDSRALGRCLCSLAFFMSATGREEAALPIASQGVQVCRRLDDKRELAVALLWQGQPERRLGEIHAARHHLEEALACAKEINDQATYAMGLVELGHVEYQTGNPQRRVELERAALKIFEDLGHDYGAVTTRHNLACSLRLLGRLQEAEQQMRDVIPQILRMGGAGPWLAEDYAALLADLGSYEAAARLIGAADAFRERSGVPRDRDQEAEYRGAFANSREALPPDTWDCEYDRGSAMSVEAAVLEALAARQEPDEAERGASVDP
jgi:tetratricopeptide (TPR) repeat protein